MGLNHTMVSRIAQWCLKWLRSVVAMCLEELLVADVFGCEWGVTTRGGPSIFFIMTHVDSVTQKHPICL